MAHHDSDMELLSKCCEGCRLSGIAEKLDTLVYDLDSGVGYSGTLLSSDEISYLNGMCTATATLGTTLAAILVASQNYDVATQISSTMKANLNNCCKAFYTNSVGDTIDACVTLINAMQEYDESFITDFYFTGYSDYPATIDDENETMIVELPYGSVKTALIPNFEISTGASLLNGEDILTSGEGTIDFTNPVTLTCLSHDESASLDYLTTVNILENTAAILSAFSIGSAVGVIDEENKAVAIEIPFGENPAAQVATFTVSDNAVVTVATVVQESGVTSNDYSNPVTYVITSEDESTENSYVVTVTVAAE